MKKESNILLFNKQDNVVSINRARRKRLMSEEEFRSKYMKNSIVATFGNEKMDIINKSQNVLSKIELHKEDNE